MRCSSETSEARCARRRPIALRYRAFCGSVSCDSNSFRRAERNSTPSACTLALEYCAISKKRSWGSFGGATLLTASRYPISGRRELGEEFAVLLSAYDPEYSITTTAPRSRMPDRQISTFIEPRLV